MAFINVFGIPITNAQNTPAERLAQAEWAMGTRFADGKYEKARKAVEDLWEMYGKGCCTLGLIYNATGSTITHVGGHNWGGHIYENSAYPKQLENGQWGVFLHVQSSSLNGGSVGAVVYRGEDKTGTHYDRMLAWYHPLNQSIAVYTEIRERGHYEHKNPALWDYILGELTDSCKKNSETGNGCRTYVKIDDLGDQAAKFEGILTLDHVV